MLSHACFKCDNIFLNTVVYNELCAMNVFYCYRHSHLGELFCLLFAIQISVIFSALSLHCALHALITASKLHGISLFSLLLIDVVLTNDAQYLTTVCRSRKSMRLLREMFRWKPDSSCVTCDPNWEGLLFSNGFCLRYIILRIINII